MISQTRFCFYSVTLFDEAAQQLSTEISTASALDILEATLVSEEFEYDIGAILALDAAVNSLQFGLPNVEKIEKFNPMFVPAPVEELDDMMEPQVATDAVKFTGMDGNPFTIKMVNVEIDGQKLLSGKAQFYPFDLPSYSEIIQSHEQRIIN